MDDGQNSLFGENIGSKWSLSFIEHIIRIFSCIDITIFLLINFIIKVYYLFKKEIADKRWLVFYWYAVSCFIGNNLKWSKTFDQSFKQNSHVLYQWLVI